ncbi:MAG: hypothetical protein ONB46_20010 [candidate division KSB1 bacterium]|nr:hypothetical protein [candidate division KSB1 bacterium]MDZ7369255.1 hypothetical protein [candidate division KSB1 bacterium]
MFLKHCLIYAALFLALTTHALFAKATKIKATKIIVHLKDGRQMAGELHSVSDSSLVVSRREAGAEHISQISTREVRQVVMKNKPRVVLQLRNGRQMTGKLHSVSDSSVTIFFLEETASAVAIKTEVRNQEIAGAKLKGKSNILKGMGLGLLIGAGAGTAIGLIASSAQADDPVEELFPSFVGINYAAYGVMAGLAVGGLVGAATSTSSKDIEISPDRPFLFLQPLARHPERGPEDKW